MYTYTLHKDKRYEVPKDKQLFSLFSEDTEIFTRVKKGKKEGWDTNFLENLNTPPKAEYLTNERGFNVGIALGVQTEHGFTVVLDHEKGGSIPEESQKSLEQEAIAKWQSFHGDEASQGGENYLLTVSKEGFEELQKYKQQINISEGEEHDIELLTSGHALIPPSKVDHKYCSDTKLCSGEGTSSYNLKYVGSTKKTNLQTVRRVIDTLPVKESQRTESSGKSENITKAEDFELPKLPDDFDIQEHYSENVPGTDSFWERLTHVTTNIDRVAKLWDADPIDTSENELALSREFAWYFFGDQQVVQFIFEELLSHNRQETLKYHENKYHARDVLEFEDYVSRPFYCNAISFNFREQLASFVWENERFTTQEAKNEFIFNTNAGEEYKERSIERALGIFQDLELIERIEHGVYRNKSINEEYIEELTMLNNGNGYKPIEYPIND